MPRCLVCSTYVCTYTCSFLYTELYNLVALAVFLCLCFFRGVKLRLQQEQRAYEQEMHRINLPLSAFTNPACDLTDEQPATARVQQTGEKAERGAEEKEEPTELQTNTFDLLRCFQLVYNCLDPLLVNSLVIIRSVRIR